MSRRRRAGMAAWLAAVLAVPFLVACAGLPRDGVPWWEARRDSSGQAPDPTTTTEAVIQVYGARTVGWRGVFAIHTWIAVKRSGASSYTRYEVIGWGVDRGFPAVRTNRAGADHYWFGSRPALLGEARGDGVDGLIDQVEAAVAAYPYRRAYRTWPGPNSNTFTAWVARAVPELRLVLPPTAIGKDYLARGALVGATPAGRGVQVSMLGLAGVLAGWDEGIEVNVLGLAFGVGFKQPALKLPLVGSVAP